MISPKARLVAVGSVLVAGAIAFALFMLSIASKSSDPAALMRVVGQVSGTVAAIGIAVIVITLIRFRGKAANAGATAAAPARGVTG